MIVSRNEMMQIESAAGEDESVLMERAGSAVADELCHLLDKGKKILILAGSGNNGGDAYVAARLLKDYFSVSVFNICGKPKTDAALANCSLLDKKMFITKDSFPEHLSEADALLDGVFGFSYHGSLSKEFIDIFDKINHSGKPVYSIDINSGAECDTGRYDKHAIRSEITFALDCYKPFHMLRKEHGLFKKAVLLSLHLPHSIKSSYMTMDEETFFMNFPQKKENSYKGSYGKTLLIGGSYGMAGALSLNIIGAKTVGAPYIEAALTHDIYSIEAMKHTTAVFHPFGHDDYKNVLMTAVKNASVVAFGSGAVNMDQKMNILDLVLQESKVPVVLDAEALKLLHHNTWVLRFAAGPVIITPHIGEFAELINKKIDDVKANKITFAKKFAAVNHVIVVLKGSNTIVFSPDGQCYINQSGNAALAQAGSGDLLTGIMAGILTMQKDIFKAVCMSVWLHGYIADIGLQDHSMQNFPLEDYPRIMDQLFKKHGY